MATLLVHHIGMATAPLLYRGLSSSRSKTSSTWAWSAKCPYDPGGAAQPSANSWPELAKWLDGRTDRAQLAHAGIGSASHLCGLLFQAARKADLQTTVCRGHRPAMADLIAGKVDLMCDQTSNTLSPIEAGRSRPMRSRPAAGSVGPWPSCPLSTKPGSGFQHHHLERCHAGHAQGRAGQLHGALKTVMQSPEVPEAPARAGAPRW